MQKEITEGNKLIAEFMGDYVMFKTASHPEPYPHFMGDDHDGYKPLDYHSGWNLLMPVVEKICRLKIGDGKEYVEYACLRTFGMLDDEGKVMVRLNGFFIHHADTLIEATYSAVIEFIQYHNSLNSPWNPEI